MKLFSIFLFITYSQFFFSQKTDRFSKLTDSLISLGKNEELIKILEKEKIKTPKDEMLLRNLGYAYIISGKLDLGEKNYNEALKLNPDCGRCFLNLSRIYFMKNELKKASDFIDKAILINPNDHNAYAFRSEIKRKNNETIGCKLDLDKAISLDPKNTIYLLQRSDDYQKKGNIELALKDIDFALKEYPKDADLYYRKGKIEFEERMYREAMRDLNLAISLDSTKDEFFIGRGAIYSALKEYKNALADYSKSIQLNPEDYYSYYNRSLDFFSLEDMDKMCEDTHKAYELLMKQDSTNSLKKELEHTMSIYCDKSKASYYYQRGIAFYNLHDFKKSIENYSNGLTLFPTNSMLLSFRGNAYLANGNFEEALVDYDNSLKNKDNLVDDIRLNYHDDYTKVGEIDMRLKGTVASMYISISEAKFALGKYEDALAEINKGIEIAPDIEDLGIENYYNMRGNIYLALNKKHEALNDFDKCIKENVNYPLAYANRALVKINLNSKVNVYSQTILSDISTPNFNANWILPEKFSIKKSDENVLSALNDCNKAIDLDANFAFAYYLRGQIKRILGKNDYCYDLLKARELGFLFQNEILVGCGK